MRDQTPDRPTVVVEFRSSAGGFDGEVLQGPDPLSRYDELIAGLSLAYCLERNARTETEWREALRVWLMSVVRWLRVEGAPNELLSLPAKLNGYLAELEQGRQPPRLTRVPRDARGNPSVGDVAVTRPATACAIVDFLVAELRPKPQVAQIEDEMARAIGWKPTAFRSWRKKFNRNQKGERARVVYDIARNEAEANRGTKSPHEIAEILLRTARTFGT
jgi:hypothetical protein